MQIVKALFKPMESRKFENLSAAVDQQKADIAYIAMMAGIELDDEEENYEQEI